MPEVENKDKVIQLDDSFNILDDILKKEPEKAPESKFEKWQNYFATHKKIAILLGFLLGLLLLGIIFLIAFLSINDKTPPPTLEIPKPPREIIINKGEDLIKDAQNLEALIQKANFLFTSGNKQEALDLYGKISNYSEVLSNYNLGVAQMQEGSYKDALASFQKAIDLDENRAISAINAAVCALYLQDLPRHRYYLQLTQTYLAQSGNLPLYSYLHALTNYYLGNYLEAFSSLIHQTSPFYKEEQNLLLASLYAYFNNNYKAIVAMDSNATDAKNWFNLGLLYARVGDYARANTLLLQSIDAFGATPQKDIALMLVKLQLAEYNLAANLASKYAQNAEVLDKNPYPIRIALKDEFFDVNVAQRRFWEGFFGQKLNAYKILFYYAPYRVFDAKEAFNVISEGGINISIESLQEAKEVLLRGQTISRVNRNIANAIKETLNGNIRNANALLKEAVETYPNHSILHYDLGLNYAQMGNYIDAYNHFLRSFHLNPKDLHAGIFALMSAKLIFKETERLESEIGKEIVNFNGSNVELEFIQALLNFVRDGVPKPLEELYKSDANLAIYYALDYALSVSLNNQSLMIKSSQKLKEIAPNDIIAGVLNLLALNLNDDPKALSLKMQNFYQDSSINKDSFYYGAAVVREIYIEIAHIIGTLHYLEQDLDERLITEQSDVRGVVQSLALTYLYLQEFEKAYTLYNSLIDDFKEQDTQTYFLAAVAAVGAGHTQNAAVLLQLAKLDAPTHYETRIGNGILYLQEKNFNAASVQFSALGNSKVFSKYFTFKIDTTKLLQNP
ncbi:MAG: tetratricopeptide repeat protein [Helicobacter sp.]|nr:tetratricopeptide repeat protein [Helicobacter sp.]